MSIDLSFFKLIISLKMFNYENKSNPSLSNKLSCFKDVARFKHFFFQKMYNLVTLIFNTT